MSLNVNQRLSVPQNVAFRGSDEESKGPNLVKAGAIGAVAGGVTGAAVTHFIKPSGGLTIKSDNVTISNLKNNLKREGENALNGAEKRTFTKGLKTLQEGLQEKVSNYVKTIKEMCPEKTDLKEIIKEIKENAPEKLAEAKNKLNEEIKALRENIASSMKEGSKGWAKNVGIGVAVGVGTAILGAIVLGKKKEDA